MHEERFFNTNAGGNFSDDDASSMRLFAVDANNNAFEDLRAELFTFFDFLSDFDGITRADVNNFCFLLSVTDLL